MKKPKRRKTEFQQLREVQQLRTDLKIMRSELEMLKHEVRLIPKGPYVYQHGTQNPVPIPWLPITY